MVKLPKYVHEVNGYLYVRRVYKVKGVRKEVRQRLPALDDPAFSSEYQRLTGGTKQTVIASQSLHELLERYKKSPEYRKNSVNTQSNKERYFAILLDKWGRFNYNSITREKVLDLRDDYQDTPGKADNLISTLSSILSWAQKRGIIEKNPCVKIERLSDGEHKAWPQGVMDQALALAPPMLRLAIQAHFYTGQRISDVIQMRRPKRADALISVVQEKTGKPVDIPMHRDFWAAIKAVPAESVFLLSGRNQQQFTDDALRDRLRTLMRDMGADYKFHGLRKNAVIALLEAGCTTWEVGAITGQTPQLVEQYARDVNRKKLAVSAVLKWEGGKK